MGTKHLWIGLGRDMAPKVIPYDIDSTEENEDWILTPKRRAEEVAMYEELAEEYKKNAADKEA